MGWIEQASHSLAAEDKLVRILLAEVRGSAPREIGASMLVSQSITIGSIGGGKLEYNAIEAARAMLLDHKTLMPRTQRLALGPSLGQCCGGHVTLVFLPISQADVDHIEAKAEGWLLWDLSKFAQPDLLSEKKLKQRISKLPGTKVGTLSNNGNFIKSHRGHFWIEPAKPEAPQLTLFGAGHVGRELVRILSKSDYDIQWIDPRILEFPSDIPANVLVRPISDPVRQVPRIRDGSDVLIMTHDHALDLAICSAVLRKGGARYVGLIGSETKAARFRKRLREAGFSQDEIDRLVCPIGGGPRNSKNPSAVAILIAAELMSL